MDRYCLVSPKASKSKYDCRNLYLFTVIFHPVLRQLQQLLKERIAVLLTCAVLNQTKTRFRILKNSEG